MDFVFELFSAAIVLLTDIASFFYSLWETFTDFFDYLKVFVFELYLSGQIMMVQLAYSVASSVLSDYEVYTFISSQFNRLPADLAYASHTLGIVDAIRIVVDAMATAFVLRVMGW